MSSTHNKAISLLYLLTAIFSIVLIYSTLFKSPYLYKDENQKELISTLPDWLHYFLTLPYVLIKKFTELVVKIILYIIRFFQDMSVCHGVHFPKNE